jgi:tRNA (cmo5U34)-methyltransferase
MAETDPSDRNGWDEEASRTFVNYGEYFVPHRRLQLQIMAALLSGLDEACQIIDLCCGEGVLAEILLDTIQGATVHGLDGSQEMLQRAAARLSRFGNRFVPQTMELSDRGWRSTSMPVDAVVSSLAIHHLEASQKQALYSDLHRMLKKNGRIVIADVIDPVSQPAKALAADLWDEAVRERALEVDGNTEAYDFFKRAGWNIFRYLDPEDIDQPSPVYEQLGWLENAGFVEMDVHWMLAGHAIFSARKP